MAFDAQAARELVDSHPLWYHTMEVAPGVTTPGWFDLRPIVDQLPWPDVAGKRCLDVGPYDGFFSFELERRGAAEVIAVDIGSHDDWDWPVALRERGPAHLRTLVSAEVGTGFNLAKRLLGSSVVREEISAYDLTPERLGQFDVVTCGSLMLHLRDPLRALEAIRGVCADKFLSTEEITLRFLPSTRRRPVAELNGLDELCQWWVPNLAGHRRMLAAAGFRIERTIRPYAERFGPAHPPPGRSVRALQRKTLTRMLAGGIGVPHSAVLAAVDP